MKQILLFLIASLFFIPSAFVQPELVLEAGDHDRIDTIVKVPFDWSKAFENWNPEVAEISLEWEGQTIPAQWIPPSHGRVTGELVFILHNPLKAGERRTYSIQGQAIAAQDSPYQVERVPKDHVKLLYEGKPILRYNDGIQIYEHDRSQKYLDRSGYVHPLWSPDGHVVTGDRCPDHPHQRGLFFAWTKCTFLDETVNFWELRTGHSETIADPEVGLGPLAAVLNAKNHLIALDQPVLTEWLHYQVYGGLSQGWVIDLTLHHEALDEPLQVEQYHYGGMAFRGPETWLDQKLGVSSSEGLPGRSANYTRARWCEMSGPVGDGDRFAGVTYFDNAENPRYPTYLRIHPNKPYFCITHQQNEGRFIDKDHPIQLSYRILVHDGRPHPTRLESMANDIEFPPKAEVRY